MAADASTANPQANMTQIGSTYVYRCSVCQHLTPIRTAFGMITTIAVWAVALHSLGSLGSIIFSIYSFFIGIPLFLLEFGYVIRLCFGADGICCRAFGAILNFDGIMRALLYCLFAIFCFYPTSTIPSIVTGSLITCTAILYAMKPIQMKKIPTYMITSDHSVAMPGSNRTGGAAE